MPACSSDDHSMTCRVELHEGDVGKVDKNGDDG